MRWLALALCGGPWLLPGAGAAQEQEQERPAEVEQSTDAPEDDGPRDDDARARELYLEGDALYEQGRYQEAIDAFGQSYELSGRPLLLFNMANAYERMGRHEEAIGFLERYRPDAPENEHAAVDSRIVALRDRLEAARQVEPRPPPPEPPPPSDDGVPMAGLVLLIAGGASLALGGAFGLAAFVAGGEAEDDCASAAGGFVCSRAAESALARESTFALIADVTAVIGLAAAATGAALVLFGGGGASSEQETISANVVLSPERVGVSAHGRF